MRSPTVYVMYGREGEVLYVGSSCLLVPRLSQHATIQEWWPDVTSITVEHVATLTEARTREKELIDQLCPRHNIQCRTDLPKRPKVRRNTGRRINGLWVDAWAEHPGHRALLIRLRQMVRRDENGRRIERDEAMAELLGLTLPEWGALSSRMGGLPPSVLSGVRQHFPALYREIIDVLNETKGPSGDRGGE